MVRKITIAFVFIFLILIFSKYTAHAAIDCLTLNNSSSQSDRDFCRNELAQIEAQLNDLLNLQKQQQQQTGTIKGDIDYITTQINALKTKIKARSIAIASLKVDINDKIDQINSLSDQIDQEYTSLAQLLRNTNDFDNQDFIYLLLSDDNLSSFYNDLESYNSINQAIKKSVDEIKGLQSETEAQKSDLEKQQNAETDAKAELESAQQQAAKSQDQQKQLLAISKNKEAEYQKLADQKKIQADKIRSALFSLAGISQKIDFGTALQYADEAQAKTNIDPAFLLAILTQESNLGANVGQCFLTDPDTGAGIGKNTGTIFPNVMKPTRDVAPFLEITNALGFNAYQTAVSCPIGGVNGWGGAMGPAQFIPSTWQLFASRLANILGHYANPWSPADAFMASSIYLTDLGAQGTSVSAQNRAACKYYGSGGSSCSYSRSVQRLKATIQANIDLL
jgi:membrane-bound lytic murein transglycosylase B